MKKKSKIINNQEGLSKEDIINLIDEAGFYIVTNIYKTHKTGKKLHKGKTIIIPEGSK